MIKKIRIQNFKGIRDNTINFELKNINKDWEQEDQVIRKGDKVFALTPTLIAKNATGKTSILEAIKFVLQFTNVTSFKETIEQYIVSYKSLYNNSTMRSYLADEPKDIIRKLFNDVVRVERDFFKLVLHLTNGKVYEIFGTEEDIMLKGFCKDKNTQISLRDLIYYALTIIIYNTPHLSNHLDDLIDPDWKCYFPQKTDDVEDIIFEINGDGEHILTHLLNSIDPSNLKFEDVEISQGNQKIISLIYKAFDLFKNGGVMLVDDIEANLDLSLIKFLIYLFEHSTINKKQAQIIITTHNPLLFKFISCENAIIFDDITETFKPIRDIHKDIKPEVALKQSNYSNSFYWHKYGQKSKNTLPTIRISNLLEIFEKGDK